jgi:hypothetical protein
VYLYDRIEGNQNHRNGEVGRAQPTARDAAPTTELEGSVVFGNVSDNSTRTGINVPIINSDQVGCELNGFAGAGCGTLRGDGGDGWDDLVQRSGLVAACRKQALQIQGKRH